MIFFLNLRYAEQYLDKNRATLKPSSRFWKWKPATVDEIKAFFAMGSAMGITKQQDMHDYWSKNKVTSTPFYGSVMPRDRFLLLISFLHYSDNTNYIPRGHDGYKPLYKLGTPYQEIVRSFATNYYPGKNIAIDEGLVPWKGHIHFNTFNAKKPNKFGLKSYQLCDQTGYCCQYELYAGKRAAASDKGAT